MLGLVLALCYLKATQPKHTPLNADTELALIWGCIGALVGAKLLYLATVLPNFLHDLPLLRQTPRDFLARYLLGGFVFYGGLFGALLAAFLYCRTSRISFSAVLTPRHPADSRLWPHRLLLQRLLLWTSVTALRDCFFPRSRCTKWRQTAASAALRGSHNARAFCSACRAAPSGDPWATDAGRLFPALWRYPVCAGVFPGRPLPGLYRGAFHLPGPLAGCRRSRAGAAFSPPPGSPAIIALCRLAGADALSFRISPCFSILFLCFYFAWLPVYGARGSP